MPAYFVLFRRPAERSYCQASQYDSRRLKEYQHPGWPRGEGTEYLGIYNVPKVGPASRGMPLIRIKLEDGKIVGQS